MELTLYQVDAFTDRLFGGNPAAVVPLDSWLDDALLQSITQENNLSETAFVVAEGTEYRIRWFTPSVEVDLCGHATLASAHILLEKGFVQGDEVRLQSRSGELLVRREGDLLVLDFPSDPPAAREIEPEVVAALGSAPEEVLVGRYHLAVFPTAAAVAELRPDMEKLRRSSPYAVVASAPGDDCDFVSRFGPKVGVPEDPVTGSAHCMLVPYWSQRLGKVQLHARQISARGGELFCEDRGDRIRIGGHAVEYLAGSIRIPA